MEFTVPRVYTDFVRSLRASATFATDSYDNLETLKLMEACYLVAGTAF